MIEIRHALSIAAFILVTACDQPIAPRVSASSREPALPPTESFREFGDYVVHFNAITTSRLVPEVARDYGIVRSDNRAMLNVSILRREAGSMGRPVPATLLVSAVNLTGQRRELDMREIREQGAIYYIAEFAVANEETLIFSIEVTPLDEPSGYLLRYRKQFYTN